MRILLVEDDEALCAAVAPLLEQEGYRVDVCRDGDDALYYMRQRMFGLCILDRMLPVRYKNFSFNLISIIVTYGSFT